MEAVDQDVLSQISIDEMVPVKQPLIVKPERFLSSYIKFGNSGFRIRIDKEGENNFDYTPEGRLLADDEKGPKYATILGTSLFELHHLLNDEDQLKKLNLTESNITNIYATSNNVFIVALEKLFSKSEAKDILTNHNNGAVSIDLKKFRDLKDEDPLIKYLNRVSERAKDMEIDYWESNKILI